MTVVTAIGRADTARYKGMRRNTPAYRRASVALFLAGFATFSLLYCVQPLLPLFASDFHINPAASSLSLSLTSGALAVAIFVSGALSDMLPRRRLMFASMAVAALLNLVAAITPLWPMLLAARLLEGLALGGVPAVAMAYLAEEMHGEDLGKAMGLYVAGTAFGGMTGRVGMGLLTGIGSWRDAMATLGIVDLLAAVGFALLLPASRRFVARRGFDVRHHARLWGGHLGRRGLRQLFAIGFLLTSVSITLFNYAGFRLSLAPFNLGPTAISLIFLVYVAGILVSPWAGQMADRIGRRRPLIGALGVMALGAMTTLSDALPLILIGILLVTMGFFAAHAVASGWVGQQSGTAKGHATSLYLLCYYLGASVTGSVGGWFWQHLGWGGVVGLTGGLACTGIATAMRMNEQGALGGG